MKRPDWLAPWECLYIAFAAGVVVGVLYTHLMELK